MTISTRKTMRTINLLLAASAASFFGFYSPNINYPRTDIAQAQTKQVNPTPLSTTDVRQVRKVLLKQTPIINQSFRVNLQECGSCFFVPAIKSERNLGIYLVKNNRVAYTFPQSEDLTPKGWAVHKVKAVSFLQLGFSGPNEDGIIVLAEYITGIGRDGAKPFPVTIVYMREGKGFKILAKESEVLTSRRVKTVREAQQILQNEFKYLP
ncbi:hypothetical protein CK510_04710 [Brunnivagina elsteri CCALA 953]|uniref:Uncharacterized protein n=2 Tax=Brunnivagina TaxID=3344733 RepID=A0A2A2TN95_9CYAN|nr:hypothetical protein CK510_04710 [Calothrix elsteri CCALA 953]